MRGKTLKVIAAVLVVAALALFGTACGGSGSSAPSGETVTFTDDLDREVTVAKNPERVVACMGSFANVWQLAGGTLVGVSEEAFDDYGIDRETVSSVGGFTSIDLEAIIALEPDFVICTAGTRGHDGNDQTVLADGLEAAGIPVAFFSVTTFDDYLKMLTTCCDITGDEGALEEYGTSQRAAIDAAIEKYGPGAEGKTVALMITYSGGVRVQNSSTQTGAMLADLGYTNIADENESLLNDFSVEALLEIDPDYILVIPMGNSEDEAAAALAALTETDAWSSLNAVQSGNFKTLPYELYVSKPNARWAEAYEGLGQILQG